tara:strand:+ start:693 stop:875 length:183 start_codon:yes stop_codon:yes gene_type:complete
MKVELTVELTALMATEEKVVALTEDECIEIALTALTSPNPETPVVSKVMGLVPYLKPIGY